MGDLPWGCGWGGGRGCGVHVGGWREGEGLACPWKPSGGPRARDAGGRCLERLASGWKKGSPGNRRPAPGGLLPRPPGLCEGGPSSVSGAAAGSASELHRTVPLRARWRRGRAAGQAVSPEVRPPAPVCGPASFAEPCRLGCFCFSFDYAPRSSGRVTRLLAFAGKETHVSRIPVLIATPALLESFPSVGILVFFPWTV